MSTVAAQALDKTQTLIDAGIITLASIAWSDVIQSIIARFNPLGKDSIKTKLIYAIVITVIVVVYTMYSDKIFKKKKEND